jgi:dihydrofolate reductase
MINLILAVSINGVIGKDGNLPWRLPEDLKRFKSLTMGGVLFVGKKTAQNLPPLKGREVIVLNRNTYPQLTDIAKIVAEKQKEAWIIGGGEVYRSALTTNIVDRVYLTLVEQEFEGDTYFDLNSLFEGDSWNCSSNEIIREKDPVVKLQIWDRVQNDSDIFERQR